MQALVTAMAVFLVGELPATQPPVAADYVISKADSGEVFARSAGGTAVAVGTDAATVIQAAIDRLPTTGGKVYIGAGSYELTRTLRIEDKHGVHLEGAARGILFSGGHEGTSLQSTKPIDLLHIHGKIKMSGVTISNLHLVGSGKNNGKAGILVTGNSDLLTLHQVGANNCGILIGSNTDCITATGGCDFGGSPRGSGVIIASDQGGRNPHNIIISSVHAHNNKHAGIHVKQGEHVVIGQCICSGHDHVAVHNHGQPYGI
jgi:hypothetical protein